MRMFGTVPPVVREPMFFPAEALAVVDPSVLLTVDYRVYVPCQVIEIRLGVGGAGVDDLCEGFAVNPGLLRLLERLVSRGVGFIPGESNHEIIARHFRVELPYVGH